MSGHILSSCCGAPALYGVHSSGWGYDGICSKCGEHSDFWKEEEDDDESYTNEVRTYCK